MIYIQCICIFFNGNTCSMLFCRLFSPFWLGLQVVEFPIPEGLPVKGGLTGIWGRGVAEWVFLPLPQGVMLSQVTHYCCASVSASVNWDQRELGGALSLWKWVASCHAGPPKMDGSWWRVLTKSGPLEKGMANHFSILTLRTPWTVSQFSRSVESSSLWHHGLQHARPPHPSPTPGLAQTHVHWISDAIQPSHPLSSPCPSAFNLSQYQGIFQGVSFSHQVAKVLELQLQHQSFQWKFGTDFL